MRLEGHDHPSAFRLQNRAQQLRFIEKRSIRPPSPSSHLKNEGLKSQLGRNFLLNGSAALGGSFPETSRRAQCSSIELARLLGL